MKLLIESKPIPFDHNLSFAIYKTAYYYNNISTFIFRPIVLYFYVLKETFRVIY